MADRRRLWAGAAALLALLAPVLAPAASHSAPTVRADVSASSQAAGAVARLSVAVRPAGAVQRGTVVVALPAGWPRPARGTVEVDADRCTTGPARLAGAALEVSGVSCAAGASISLSVRGRLPVKAARYELSATLTGRLGGPGRTSQSADASFTVVPAKAHHLVLTPPSTTVAYGGTRAFRAFAEDAYGNRRGEVTDRASFTMSPDGTCSGAVCGDGAHAGDHVVTGTLDDLTGYADLSVEPRHVTVTAQPATKVYGAADPAFAYTVDGLLGGSTTLAGVTCGVAGPHAATGSYPIGCSGANDPDYVVDSYLTSTLTVTPAPLLVRVSGTQTYGGAPTYAADLASAGLVDGDTPVVVGGVLSCTTTATAGSAVGSYPITGCTGLSAANYSVGYSYGTVQVTPRAVTVRADDKTKVAGAADPAFTYSTVPAGLTLPGVTCGVAGAHEAASSYAVTCTTTTDPNYAQTSVAGTLTVTAPPAVCGNAVPEAGEACDDGNTTTETTCPYGQATCAPTCDATCSATVFPATGGVCGDAVTQTGEACDDGNTTTETSCPYGAATCNVCNSTCSAALNLSGNYCGDSKVTDGEVCDDGNTTDETSCPYGQATCNACNSTCSGVLPLIGGYCGDDIKQDSEFCDDGNTTSETSCPYGVASCMACSGTCSATLSLTGDFCGDGRVAYGEACDDGNQVDSDGCSNSCTLPSG